jgi:hypothetical protein
MPKNDFWDILVKTEQKSKQIFLVIPFMYKNIKEEKKLCLKIFIFKRVLFLKWRLMNPIESNPVVRKKNSNRFGIRTLESCLKTPKIILME